MMAYRMGRTSREESDGVPIEIQIYEIQERLETPRLCTQHISVSTLYAITGWVCPHPSLALFSVYLC